MRCSGGTEAAPQLRSTLIIGDVADLPCLLIDDMITTGGTIAKAITALLRAGARAEIWVAATHGVLVDGAHAQLNHPAVREILVTDILRVRSAGFREMKSRLAFLQEIMLSLADDEDSAGRMAHDALGSAAEPCVFQTRVAACGNDDKVDVLRVRFRHNLLVRRSGPDQRRFDDTLDRG